MVKDVSIKEESFVIADLVSTVGGTMEATLKNSINGTIHKIQNVGGNFNSTGSFFLITSGTVNENIYTMVSGTIPGAANVAFTQYPVTYQTINNGTTGSPRTTNMVVNGPLQLIGSGLGALKSGLGFKVFYI